MDQDPDIFSLPAPDFNGIRRHFLRAVYCELRFPILLELTENQPVQLQKVLRPELPNYERHWHVRLEAGAPPQYEPRYAFRSRDGAWSLELHSDRLTLATTAYHGYSDFSNRFLTIFEEVKQRLDIPFLLRVGLRYVNAIPLKDGDLPDGWVNSALTKPVEGSSFATVAYYFQEILGLTSRLADAEGFALRHGLESPNNLAYILDLDLSRVDIDPPRLSDTLGILRLQANRLFSWSIGPHTREYLTGQEQEA